MGASARRIVAGIFALLLACCYVSGLNFVIKQNSISPGQTGVYAPYVLWNDAVENAHDALSTPLSLQSANGQLDIELSVRVARVNATVFEYSSRVFCYHDICGAPGPTFYVKPGDRLRIKLKNELGASGAHGANRTNWMSSLTLADESQTGAPASSRWADGGETLQYDYSISADTPPGHHWYGSQVAGLSAMQCMGGLMGALVVMPSNLGPALPTSYTAVRSQLVVLSHIFLSKDTRVLMENPTLQFSYQDELNYSSGISSLSLTYLSSLANSMLPLAAKKLKSSSDAILINGQYQPLLHLLPQEWIVLNLLAAVGDKLLVVELPGCELRLIERDGRAISESESVEQVFLSQLSGASLAVRCSLPGEFYLRTTSPCQTSLDWRLDVAQICAMQVLAVLEVEGTNYTMVDPPTNLTFLSPLSPDLPSPEEVASLPQVSLAVNLRHGFGAGVNCRLPCYDQSLCAALYGEENAFSPAVYPTVIAGLCTFPDSEVGGENVTLPVQEAVPAGSYVVVTLWGPADVLGTVCFPQPAQLLSYSTVSVSSSNIVLRDHYAPQPGSSDEVLREVLGASAGDWRRCWLVPQGRTVVRTRLLRPNSLSVSTSFLKFADTKKWNLHVSFVPTPTSTPSPTPSGPTTPMPSPSLPTTDSVISIPASVIETVDSSPWKYLCASNGSSFTYAERLVAEMGAREIRSQGCPNHFSICQSAQCGGPGKTRALISPSTVQIPLYPRFRRDPLDWTCSVHRAGVALNGVGIFGPADETSTPSCLPLLEYLQKTGQSVTEAVNFTLAAMGRTVCTLEGNRGVGLQFCAPLLPQIFTQVDKCGGWAAAKGGVYSYRSTPSCLLYQLQLQQPLLSGSRAKHSAQVGFAMDGFPIYGPYSIRGIRMLPCGHALAHRQLCLDSCSGYRGELPGIDAYLYRYYLPEDSHEGSESSSSELENPSCGSTVNDEACQRLEAPCCARSLPTLLYPSTVSCLRGCRYNETDCLHTSTGVGTSSYYIPAVSRYVTEVNGASFLDLGGEGQLAEESGEADATAEEGEEGDSQTHNQAASQASSAGSHRFPLLLTRQALDPSLILYNLSNPEEPQSSVLESGPQDSFLDNQGVVLDKALSRIYLATGSSIQMHDLETQQTSQVVAGLVEVHINGYHLGASIQDILGIWVASQPCTSIVVVAESGYLRCMALSSAALAYARWFQEQSIDSIIAGAAQIDVTVVTVAGTARGISLHAWNDFYSDRGAPVISLVHMLILPFRPVGLYLHGQGTDAKLLFSNAVLEGATGVLRVNVDGTNVQLVAAGEALAFLMVNSSTVLLATSDGGLQLAPSTPDGQPYQESSLPWLRLPFPVDIFDSTGLRESLQVLREEYASVQGSVFPFPPARTLLVNCPATGMTIMETEAQVLLTLREGVVARIALSALFSLSAAEVNATQLLHEFSVAQPTGMQTMLRSHSRARLQSLAIIPAVGTSPAIAVVLDLAAHQILFCSLRSTAEVIQVVDLHTQWGIPFPSTVLVESADEQRVVLLLGEYLGRLWRWTLSRAGGVDVLRMQAPEKIVEMPTTIAHIKLRADAAKVYFDSALWSTP